MEKALTNLDDSTDDGKKRKREVRDTNSLEIGPRRQRRQQLDYDSKNQEQLNNWSETILAEFNSIIAKEINDLARVTEVEQHRRKQATAVASNLDELDDYKEILRNLGLDVKEDDNIVKKTNNYQQQEKCLTSSDYDEPRDVIRLKNTSTAAGENSLTEGNDYDEVYISSSTDCCREKSSLNVGDEEGVSCNPSRRRRHTLLRKKNTSRNSNSINCNHNSSCSSCSNNSINYDDCNELPRPIEEKMAKPLTDPMPRSSKMSKLNTLRRGVLKMEKQHDQTQISNYSNHCKRKETTDNDIRGSSRSLLSAPEERKSVPFLRLLRRSLSGQFNKQTEKTTELLTNSYTFCESKDSTKGKKKKKKKKKHQHELDKSNNNNDVEFEKTTTNAAIAISIPANKQNSRSASVKKKKFKN